jgi:hypothetical protein
VTASNSRIACRIVHRETPNFEASARSGGNAAPSPSRSSNSTNRVFTAKCRGTVTRQTLDAPANLTPYYAPPHHFSGATPSRRTGNRSSHLVHPSATQHLMYTVPRCTTCRSEHASPSAPHETRPDDRRTGVAEPGKRRTEVAAPRGRRTGVAAAGKRRTGIAAPGKRRTGVAAPGGGRIGVGPPGRTRIGVVYWGKS